MIKHINKENFKTEILDSTEPILVDFFATWCGPCNMLSPILENISNTRADFNIAKVNIDEFSNRLRSRSCSNTTNIQKRKSSRQNRRPSKRRRDSK